MAIPQDVWVKLFETFWMELFSGSIHLDSALSKRPAATKSALATLVPTFLRTPAALCEGMGVGVGEGEPWNLSQAQLAKWETARILAERFNELRNAGAPFPGFVPEPMEQDFPPYMVGEWKQQWPRQIVDDLIRVLGQEASMTLRARREFGAEGLIRALKKEEEWPVRITPSAISPLGVCFSGFSQVMNTELFEKGAFEIQDEGSQFMALFALWPELFGPRLQKEPGAFAGSWQIPDLSQAQAQAWTVVDACAGAGGKTLALADALQGRGRVFAYDTVEGKLMALRRRAKRAGVNNIQAVSLKEGDEASVIQKFRHRADVVLVDAPCSGWGVLRRNPDIKWRDPEDDLVRMPEIQFRLLKLYSELVAPGGRMVFGVCTFRKQETLEVVERFAAEQSDFELKEGGYLGPGPSDGFFMQAFERRKKAK